MLGENHALLNDFSEYKDNINRLLAHDSRFQSLSQRYHQLDKQTRSLEERGQPIDDGALHQMKVERAHLKDELFDMIKMKPRTYA